MTTVEIVESFTKWLNENVCNRIKLKRPPVDDTERGEYGFDYKLVNPVAYPFFPATKETLPRGVKTPVPSILVAMKSGKETGNAGTMNIDLVVSTWCDGIYYPKDRTPECATEDDETDLDSGLSRARTQETWRGMQGVIDVLIRELSLNPIVADGMIKIDKQNAGFNYQLFSNETFPYIHGQLSITIHYNAERKPPAIHQFL